MAAQLGSFTYDMVLQYAQFEDALTKVQRIADQQTRAIQRTLENAANSISDKFAEIAKIAVAAVSIDAVVELGKRALETADQIGKLSQKTGIAVDSLSGIAAAAQLSDISMQDFGTSMAKFSKFSADAANGGKESSAAFAAMGINIKDANGHLLPMDQLLGKVADKFAGYKDGAEKSAIATLALGKSGANLIPFLNEGSAGIAKVAAEAKALGYDFTATAKPAEEFNDGLKKMSMAAVGFANDIAKELLPYLIAGEQRLLSFIKSMRENGTLQTFARGIAEVVENLDRIAIVIGARLSFNALVFGAQAATVAFTQMAASATVLAGSMQLVGGSMLSVKTGLAVVTAAAAGWEFGSYLEQNFLQAKLAGIALVDGLLTAWERLKEGAAIVWLSIQKYIVEAVGVAEQAGAKILEVGSYLSAAQGNIAGAQELKGLSEKFASATVSVNDYDKKIAEIKQNADAAVEGIHAQTTAMADNAIANDHARDAAAAAGKAFADSLDKIVSSSLPAIEAAKTHAEALKLAAGATEQIEKAERAAIAAGLDSANAHKAAERAISAVNDAAKLAAPNVVGLGKAHEAVAKDALEAAKFLDSLASKIGGPYDKAWSEYAGALDQVSKMAAKFRADGMKEAEVLKFIADASALAADHLREQTDAQTAIDRVLGKVNVDYANQNRLLGLSGTAREVEIEYLRLQKEMDASLLGVMGPLTEEQQKQVDSLHALAQAHIEQQKAAELANSAQSPYEKMQENLALVTKELERIKALAPSAFNTEYAERLQKAIGGIRQSMLEYANGEIGQAISSLQSMAGEGTRAYAELKVAQDALNLTTAIGAIVNQGLGDPYTAFARIAAMAAIMATMVHDIGAIGSSGAPLAQSAEVRQATQGTGTILGDAKAQSDSIAKATAITANATQQLVGLNRGMLNALLSLQQALGAAGTQLARGAGDATFPSVAGADNAFNNFLSSNDPLGGDPITKAIGNFLFGGSKKVIDQGIVIFGGALNDMLTNIAVGAYQTIHTSGGIFSSGSTKDQTQSVSDDFSKQFQLVIKSIVDTVEEGAKALGISQSQIDAAIAAYHVAEQHISLQGLSAEDQQKALEAVFSSIFDGLAGAVVPFIAQFQKVGEGLGETLVRVATEVQVTQEAMKELGLAIATTDPEKFAQIADGLIQAAGGIDAFISGMNSFVDKFAPDSAKFAFEQDSLTSALSQVGLTLPTTREGFYDLMKSLDATTTQGQQQIATLLRLADVADAYYTALEKVGDAQGDAIKKIQDALQSLVDSTTQLASQLFGTGADQIQARIDSLLAFGKQTGLYDFVQITALKKQLKDQQDAQAHAQQVAQATSLINNFGQLGFMTGETLDQLAAQFNVPLDKLAQIFGTDRAGLDKQFAQSEALAQATLGTEQNTAYANELLANLIAVQKGLPEPYSAADLAAASTPISATFAGGRTPSTTPGIAPPGRPGGVPQPVAGTAAPAPAAESASPAASSNAPHLVFTKALNQFNDTVQDNSQQLRDVRQILERYGMGNFSQQGYRGNGQRNRALAK